MSKENDIFGDESTLKDTDYSIPKQSDELFKEENDIKTGAWLKNPANGFYKYSEGYKLAGEKLFDACVKKPTESNILVFPLVFNFRHCVELKLKELIFLGYLYLDENEKDFPDKHSLMQLWNLYKNEILVNIEHLNTEKELRSAERIISQLNTNDPESIAYRYHITKSPDRKQTLGKYNTLDLLNFKQVINRLINFFDWHCNDILIMLDNKQISY